jgi:hypothetical protein
MVFLVLLLMYGFDEAVTMITETAKNHPLSCVMGFIIYSYLGHLLIGLIRRHTS